MQKNYKYTLQDRLNYHLQTQDEWLEYFLHQQINEKAKKKFYGNKKIIGWIIELYFLPFNLLKYYKKKRAQHIYSKVLNVISVLKEEINEINNKNNKLEG